MSWFLRMNDKSFASLRMIAMNDNGRDDER
jgi:hypothetical protein